MSNSEPWGQVEGESSLAFQAFTIYRDLGPSRSLSKAYRLVCKANDVEPNPTGNGRIGQWSAKFSWSHRCLEHEKSLDKVRLEERLKFIRKDARKARILATLIESKAKKALLKIPSLALKPKDILSWIEASIRIKSMSTFESEDSILEKLQMMNEIDPFGEDLGLEQEELARKAAEEFSMRLSIIREGNK